MNGKIVKNNSNINHSAQPSDWGEKILFEVAIATRLQNQRCVFGENNLNRIK